MSSVTPLMHVVRKRTDQQLLEVLDCIVSDVKLGRVSGIIIAAHYGADEFSYAGAGSFCDHPLLAAQALKHLSGKFFP